MSGFDLRIVDVSELPGFHNPFKCGRREVFEEALVDAARPYARSRPWQLWRRPVAELVESMQIEDKQAVTRSVRERFGPDEIAECRQRCAYHQLDWQIVAGLACGMVEGHGQELTEDTIDHTAARLAKPERMLFWSLFYEPINWVPASRTLTNGQHRACGLAVGGAQRVPIAPGPVEVEARRVQA